MLINKDFLNAKSEKELREQVISQLKNNGCCIVSGADEAAEYLAYNSGREKEEIDIESEIEEDFSFDIEEESFRVVITAYYEDAGSNDYFYKVVVE
ncbi:hypothetical protein [Prevotella pallens]|jgi:hypothetical protein|uniref:hypothetical protein n=1 Tax=Prevotella pallens TaxID=60133 RepID=UPI001CAEC241|nr:hypothetical protein [Prevotella pallens]MBF1465547.1 hypothetical protein [Prevotella pallens]